MSTFPKDYNLWPRVEVYGTDFRSCLLDMATTVLLKVKDLCFVTNLM